MNFGFEKLEMPARPGKLYTLLLTIFCKISMEFLRSYTHFSFSKESPGKELRKVFRVWKVLISHTPKIVIDQRVCCYVSKLSTRVSLQNGYYPDY